MQTRDNIYANRHTYFSKSINFFYMYRYKYDSRNNNNNNNEYD